MSVELDKPLRIMVVCPECNVGVAEHHLKRHLKKVHSKSSEIDRNATQNLKLLVAAQEQYLSTKIYCSTCGDLVQLMDIKQHFARIHCIPVTKDMLALLGLSEPQNMFKSARERDAYWRSLNGMPDPKSEDLFDRTRVLNGGAYGLGKNRKN